VPELPEVETVVRDLRPCLVGRRIASIEASDRLLRRHWSADWHSPLQGRRILAMERRGKWILVSLDRGIFLVIHLGMTGQLTVVSAQMPLAPHTHLVFQLDRGREQLRYRDVRRFGSVSLFPDRKRMEDFFRQADLGPEPFELDPAYWRQRLAKTRRNLKAILLDQRVVAGVGNIYADEALFEARLHPCRLGADLKTKEADRLRRAIPVVLQRAIDRHGTSIRDYIGGLGRKGEYQQEFRVYGRTGQTCIQCGRSITRIRLAGRSTHFCPRCQRNQH